MKTKSLAGIIRLLPLAALLFALPTAAMADYTTSDVISLNISNDVDCRMINDGETQTLAGLLPDNAWQNTANADRAGVWHSGDARNGYSNGVTAWDGAKQEVTTLSDVVFSWAVEGSGTANYGTLQSRTPVFRRAWLARASGAGEFTSVVVQNIPYEKYDVIVYVSGNAEVTDVRAVLINGVPYKGDTNAENGTTLANSNTDTWGSVGDDTLTLGGNALKVMGLTCPDLQVSMKNATTWGICAIQIVRDMSAGTGNAQRATGRVISVNLQSSKADTNKNTAYKTGDIGIVRVPAEAWTNDGLSLANNSANYDSDVGVTVKEWDGTAAKDLEGVTLHEKVKNAYYYTANDYVPQPQVLSAYSDDNSEDEWRATLTLTGVPYKKYDVIVYCATDSENHRLGPVTVNGTPYRWDSAQKATVQAAGEASTAETRWGYSQSRVMTYGGNAIRVTGQTASTLTIRGGTNANTTRGGIAGFQVVDTYDPDDVEPTNVDAGGTYVISSPLEEAVKLVCTGSLTITGTDAYTATEADIAKLDVDGVAESVTLGEYTCYALADSRTLPGGKIVFGEGATITATETQAEYGYGEFYLEGLGEASEVKLTRFIDGSVETLKVSNGIASLYGDVVVSGKACWVDYEMDYEKGNPSKTGWENSGTDTTNLHVDSSTGGGNIDGDNAFYNGILYTYAHPYRDDLGTFPDTWTAVVRCTVPNYTDASVITFGWQDSVIGLVAGETPNTEMRLVQSAKNTHYVTNAVMKVQNATTAQHVYIFTVEANQTVTVYCDGSLVTSVTFDSPFTIRSGFQVGSVLGGVANTGFVRFSKNESPANTLSEAEQKNARIDCVRLYNYAISPAQIAALSEEFPAVKLYEATVEEYADTYWPMLDWSTPWDGGNKQSKVILTVEGDATLGLPETINVNELAFNGVEGSTLTLVGPGSLSVTEPIEAIGFTLKLKGTVTLAADTTFKGNISFESFTKAGDGALMIAAGSTVGVDQEMVLEVLGEVDCAEGTVIDSAYDGTDGVKFILAEDALASVTEDGVTTYYSDTQSAADALLDSEGSSVTLTLLNGATLDSTTIDKLEHRGYVFRDDGVIVKAVAKIVETEAYYPTLADAIYVVGEGDTIELLGPCEEDIELYNQSIILSDEANNFTGTLSGNVNSTLKLLYPRTSAIEFDDWSGRVELPNIEICGNNGLNLSFYGNQYSTVVVNNIGEGVWLSNAEIPSTIELAGDVTLSEFSSSFPNTIKKLTGSGSIAFISQNANGYFLLENIDEFQGSLSTVGPGIAIGSRPLDTSTFGQIYLPVSATVAEGAVWTAANGINIATVGATLTIINGGTVVCDVTTSVGGYAAQYNQVGGYWELVEVPAPTPCKVTFSAGDNGTILVEVKDSQLPVSNEDYVDDGTVIVVTVTPDEGYKVDEVTVKVGDDDITEELEDSAVVDEETGAVTFEVTVTADTELDFTFAKKGANKYTFTVSVGTGVKIMKVETDELVPPNPDGTYTVNTGATVRVTWEADEGYELSSPLESLWITIDDEGIEIPLPTGWEAMVKPCVAYVTYGRPAVTNYYTTVEAAVADENARYYGVHLMSDVTLVSTLTVDKPLMLLGEGKTITGNIEVADGGALNPTKLTVVGDVTVQDGGSLKLFGGDNGVAVNGGIAVNSDEKGATLQFGAFNTETPAFSATGNVSLNGTKVDLVVNSLTGITAGNVYKLISGMSVSYTYAMTVKDLNGNELDGAYFGISEDLTTLTLSIKAARIVYEYYDTFEDARAASAKALEDGIIIPPTITLLMDVSSVDVDTTGGYPVYTTNNIVKMVEGEQLYIEENGFFVAVALDDALTTPPYYLITGDNGMEQSKVMQYEVKRYVARVYDKSTSEYTWYKSFEDAVFNAYSGAVIEVLYSEGEAIPADWELTSDGTRLTRMPTFSISSNGPGTVVPSAEGLKKDSADIRWVVPSGTEVTFTCTPDDADHAVDSATYEKRGSDWIPYENGDLENGQDAGTYKLVMDAYETVVAFEFGYRKQYFSIVPTDELVVECVTNTSDAWNYTLVEPETEGENAGKYGVKLGGSILVTYRTAEGYMFVSPSGDYYHCSGTYSGIKDTDTELYTGYLDDPKDISVSKPVPIVAMVGERPCDTFSSARSWTTTGDTKKIVLMSDVDDEDMGTQVQLGDVLIVDKNGHKLNVTLSLAVDTDVYELKETHEGTVYTWTVVEKGSSGGTVIDPSDDAEETVIPVDTDKPVDEQKAEAEAAVQEMVITVPAGDEEAAAVVETTGADYDSYFTKTVEQNGDGEWVAKVELDPEVVLPETATVEDPTTGGETEITEAEGVLASVMEDADEAVVPSVPGLYYSMEACENLEFEEPYNGGSTLSGGTSVTVAKPTDVPATAKAVFYRMKVTVRPVMKTAND